MARDNVGIVKCPFTGDLAVVRKDVRGKLYYYSQAGKIAPNLPQGQAFLSANMKPLTGFTVTELAAGAPPIVKPLTDEPEPKRTEIPLTDKGGTETPQKAKAKSILEEFGL